VAEFWNPTGPPACIGVDRSTIRLALGYANDHAQVIDDLDRALAGDLAC
jgi:hypothetical protein